MKLNNKRLQYYRNFTGNRVLFLPNLCADADEFGTFIVNGEKFVVGSEDDFRNFLIEFKANSLQIQGDSEESVRTLIHFIDLNKFLKVKYVLFRKFFKMVNVCGASELNIFRIDTNYFTLIELSNCVRLENDNPTIEDYWDAVTERLREGLKLPQIAYSYAYGSYKQFVKRYRDQFKDENGRYSKRNDPMEEIKMKTLNIVYNHYNLINEIKENPSIIWQNPNKMKAYKGSIKYFDRHDCWDYYLLTEEFPISRPKCLIQPSIEKVYEIYDSGTKFEIDAFFKFKGNPEPKFEAFHLPQFTLVKFKEEEDIYYYRLTGTEIDFEYINEFYDMDKFLDARVKKFFYYEKSAKLPKEYLNLLETLIETKHNAPKDSLERINAKEALKIQIGKGIKSIPTRTAILTEGNNIATKLIKLVPDGFKNKIRSAYNNVILYPQVSIRCQAAERLHIMRVIEDLLNENALILNIDTDGIVYKEDPLKVNKLDSYFEALNEEIKEKYDRIEGVGCWDSEGTFTQFMGFNLKQYLLKNQNGEVKSAIAGCAKKIVNADFDEIEKNQKLVVPRGQKVIINDKKNHFVLREEIDFTIDRSVNQFKLGVI